MLQIKKNYCAMGDICPYPTCRQECNYIHTVLCHDFKHILSGEVSCYRMNECTYIADPLPKLPVD